MDLECKSNYKTSTPLYILLILISLFSFDSLLQDHSENFIAVTNEADYFRETVPYITDTCQPIYFKLLGF